MCLVPRGLRAIGTVFCTAARLDANQSALLDLRGVPVHAMYRSSAVEQLVEGEVVNVGDLLSRPIVTNGGINAGHGPGLFLRLMRQRCALAIAVGETGRVPGLGNVDSC